MHTAIESNLTGQLSRLCTNSYEETYSLFIVFETCLYFNLFCEHVFYGAVCPDVSIALLPNFRSDVGKGLHFRSRQKSHY